MTALPVNLGLPELQEQLHHLIEGGIFQISVRDYRRLFGVNDIATERLCHFAKGMLASLAMPTPQSCFASNLQARKRAPSAS
jgi:hypothetical protein